MKKYILIIIVWASQHAFSQNTNVYDFAPSAQFITNGTADGGGATGRNFNSTTHLTAGQYIILDCGISVPVDNITFGTFWSADTRYIPKSYTIGYSNDGVNFTNLVTEPNNHNLSPNHTFNTVWSRYWKITVTAVQDGETQSSISGLLLLAHGVGAAFNNSYWNGGSFGSTSVHYMGGNVGIGTTSPAQKLTIESAGTAGNDAWIQTRLGSSNASHTGLLITPAGSLSSSNVQWALGRYAATNDLRLWSWNGAADNVAMSILGSSGNVGIGTNDPGAYKLAVEGTIGARKVKVTTVSWADHVFHPTYRLPPLSEVEQFIQQHHHLPDVPSATEVEKNGIDLGDNQATLLKKIEELTLYIIEQNKRNEAQNDLLKKLNQTLEFQQREIEALKKQKQNE
jgi:hypothetical protein